MSMKMTAIIMTTTMATMINIAIWIVRRIAVRGPCGRRVFAAGGRKLVLRRESGLTS